MKVYKGTDKNMQCRGMQYEIGKKVISEDAIKCGDKGFHSCEAPFDVLRHYPAKNGSRYFEAEADGKIDCGEEKNDTKIASSELTLKAEIGLPGLIKAQIEYTRKKAESGTAGGYKSNLAGGYRSNLAGGDWSNLAGGNRSNLAGGNSSLIVGRNGCTAKGGKNSIIVLSEWEWNIEGEYAPIAAKAEIVDGKRIKADTWYKLENGEFVEVNENAET